MEDVSISFKELLEQATDNQIPVVYELYLTRHKPPLISYMESTNVDTESSFDKTARFSTISNQMKIWSEDIEYSKDLLKVVDGALFAAGWKRTYKTEYMEDGITCISCRYTADFKN